MKVDSSQSAGVMASGALAKAENEGALKDKLNATARRVPSGRGGAGMSPARASKQGAAVSVGTGREHAGTGILDSGERGTQ